jgi:hypothetical protein
VATVTTPALSSSATAIFPRLGFVHFEGPAAMLLAVERRNRRLGFLFAAHLDETEPLAPAGVSIVDYVRAFHCAIGGEQLLQGFVVNVETQISYIQLLTHDDLLCGHLTYILLCRSLLRRGLCFAEEATKSIEEIQIESYHHSQGSRKNNFRFSHLIFLPSSAVRATPHFPRCSILRASWLHQYNKWNFLGRGVKVQ